MELADAIRSRRSVRKYTDYYVSDEEITELMEAARWAPSWANSQVWEYIVVRERGLIEKTTATYSKKNPAIKGSLAATALIAVCAKTGVSGCYAGENVTKFSNWFMFDLGLSVQNLCLKAHELGLGTVVVGLMDQDACKKVLQVPEGYDLVAVIPIGRPAGEAKDGPPRKALKDFVHRDTFGNPFA